MNRVAYWMKTQTLCLAAFGHLVKTEISQSVIKSHVWVRILIFVWFFKKWSEFWSWLLEKHKPKVSNWSLFLDFEKIVLLFQLTLVHLKFIKNKTRELLSLLQSAVGLGRRALCLLCGLCPLEAGREGLLVILLPSAWADSWKAFSSP